MVKYIFRKFLLNDRVLEEDAQTTWVNSQTILAYVCFVQGLHLNRGKEEEVNVASPTITNANILDESLVGAHENGVVAFEGDSLAQMNLSINLEFLNSKDFHPIRHTIFVFYFLTLSYISFFQKLLSSINPMNE